MSDAHFPGRPLFDGRTLGRCGTADEYSRTFRAGECDYSIHGANRLGANSLVSCVYGGFVAAPSAIEYARTSNVVRLKRTDFMTRAEAASRDQRADHLERRRRESVQAHEEMGKVMTDNVTVVRYNDRLKATDDKLLELQNDSRRSRSTIRISGQRRPCRTRVSSGT
jgi:succinate dehydrogenase / fumarate reductase flavoprotein subunit